MKIRNLFSKVGAAIALATVSAVSYADITNAETLGESFTMVDAIAGILAVAGVLLAFHMLYRALILIINMVKRA